MIQVYYTEVFPFLEENTFFSHLNKIEEERRKKILKNNNEKVRLRSLSAGCLLHDVLCRKLGISPENSQPFDIAYEEGGKPYLVKYPKLHFNLSHSGDYVCCAVGDVPVGVDIQKLVEIREGVAGRFFTDEDNERLAKCTEKEREKLFFRMWSIKESYIKLTGKGLSGGLDHFEIDWQRKGILERNVQDAKKEKDFWESIDVAAYFEEWDQLDQYCFCVCAERDLEKVVWEEVYYF